MFCYQCEEANKGIGCTTKGVCGKDSDVSDLMDLYIHVLKGISYLNYQSPKKDEKVDKLVVEGLFSTITNANFDKNYFFEKISEALDIKEDLKKNTVYTKKNDAIEWFSKDKSEMLEKAKVKWDKK